MEGITININKASDGGYMYDIYKTGDLQECADAEGESDDGGQCTTSLKSTIEMACDHAKLYLKNSLYGNRKTKI